MFRFRLQNYHNKLTPEVSIKKSLSKKFFSPIFLQFFFIFLQNSFFFSVFLQIWNPVISVVPLQRVWQKKTLSKSAEREGYRWPQLLTTKTERK